MKILLFTCFLIFVKPGFAQTGEVLKAEAELKQSVTDSAKVNALLMLSAAHKTFDQSVLYAEQALEISKKKNLPEGEAASEKRLGDIFFHFTNYPRSLEHFVNSLKIYEKLNDRRSIAGLMNSIGNVYARQIDFKMALDYYRAYADAKKQLKEDERIAFFGIGKAHEFLGNLDSALIYYQRAYEYFQSTPTNPRTPFVLIHLANVHRKKNNNDLANSYARMAGSYVKYSQDSVGISSVYTHIAEVFHHSGARDSAIYYAQKAFQISDRIQNLDSKADPALLLAELYESEPAKAYYYYRIGKTIEDTMFSRDRVNQIQSISYEEKLRQKELSEARQEMEITRRNNIQYAAIGLGLALACLIFILLSRSIIVNEKGVKFLGILILLMVFEFLNLVLHPYLGQLTHHSPILMLLAMVAIAALLIPTHHHLEHWITKRMVQKNKKVRLQTARKIVERLEKEEVET